MDSKHYTMGSMVGSSTDSAMDSQIATSTLLFQITNQALTMVVDSWRDLYLAMDLAIHLFLHPIPNP